MPITFEPSIVEIKLLDRLEKIFNYYEHLKDAQGNFSRDDFQIRIAKASFEENIQLFSGRIRISTISEMNQFKLYLFVVHVLDNNIPTENEVSQLFGTTNSNAQSLLRNMQSRFRYELQFALETSILNLLNSLNLDDRFGQGINTYYEMYVRSKSLVRTINQIIQFAEVPRPPISICRGFNNKYQIKEITRLYLEEYIN